MTTQEFEDSNNNSASIASITIKMNAKREAYGEFNVKQKDNETETQYFERFDAIKSKFLNEIK